MAALPAVRKWSKVAPEEGILILTAQSRTIQTEAGEWPSELILAERLPQRTRCTSHRSTRLRKHHARRPPCVSWRRPSRERFSSRTTICAFPPSLAGWVAITSIRFVHVDSPRMRHLR